MKDWDITVEQFQEALPYFKKAIEEKDSIEALNSWCSVIAVVTNSTFEDVQNLPIEELKSNIVSLGWMGSLPTSSPKFKVKIGDIEYKAPKEESDFNTSRYIEYKTFLQGDYITNLHLILATIYRPESNQSHAERAEIFKKAKMYDVYGMVFFWTKRFLKRRKSMLTYGMKEAKKEQQKALSILLETLNETLDSIGDGTEHSTK